MYCNVLINIEKLKKNKILYILKIALILSVVYSKCGHEFKKILKKKNQLKHQQFLV